MALCGAISVHAQQTSETVRSPILVIDSEQLYSNSAFGQRVAQEQIEAATVLGAENTEIEADLAKEEQDLTALRATVEPAEFRELADAFDEKVQATRARQVSKSKALTQNLERQRVLFFQSASPVLEQLMRDAGAAVVMERRNVFFSVDAVDITGIAILRINAALGAGATPQPVPE